MSRRTTRCLTAVIVCAVLALGACSDDDEPTGDTTAVTEADGSTSDDNGGGDGASTSTSTSADEPRDPAADAAMVRAEAANLTIDDFPSGWQNLPPAEAEVGVAQLCTTVDLDVHLLAMARSDSFSYSIEPGTLQASTSVMILDDEAAAIDLIADLRTEAFVGCATEQLTRGTDLYTITGNLGRNESEPDLGDEAVALSGDFVVTPSGDSVPHALSTVVVAIRQGDTVVTFGTTAQDRGLDEEVTRGLLTTIDERLAG